jgi:lysophospholipase L1-like esterase
MNSVKNTFFNVLTFVFILLISLFLAEMVVRLKNADQKNYNIEMWRYSKILKVQSEDPNQGHVHRANKKAKLQGVEIRLNQYGMRGPEPDLSKKKILFLGSSNTLGWGVPEEKTMTSLLQKELGSGVTIMNAGIGNYNSLRYVTLFKKKLRALHPDTVVVHYFMRDAEVLEPGRNNFLLRNSELAVLFFQMLQEKTLKTKTVKDLTGVYRDLYQEDSEGYKTMFESLTELQKMAKEDGFKVILAMTPDIHQMDPYPFDFVDEKMKQIAAQLGWTFVNLYRPLSAVPAKDLWAMPGDPHLNAEGHRIMAETLRPYLE